MKSKDFVSGAFWLLVALAIIWQSLELKMGDYHAPGPGYLPLGVGLGMAGIAAIIMGRAALFSSGQGLALGLSRAALKKLGVVLGGLLIYAFLFMILGFLPSTFLFMIILFKGVEPQSWPKSLLLAGGVTFFSYLLFDLLLKSELPRGILD